MRDLRLFHPPGLPRKLTSPTNTREPHQPHEPHEHPHDHGHQDGQEITLEQKILAKNDDLAAGNRAWLRDRGILAVNLMSSPGSGKTTLLERSGRDLAGRPRSRS